MTDTRYIAFFMITGSALGHGTTPAAALEAATAAGDPANSDFIEVRDCGQHGRKILDRNMTLGQVSSKHPVVFRGAGYPHREPVAITA